MMYVLFVVSLCFMWLCKNSKVVLFFSLQKATSQIEKYRKDYEGEVDMAIVGSDNDVYSGKDGMNCSEETKRRDGRESKKRKIF